MCDFQEAIQHPLLSSDRAWPCYHSINRLAIYIVDLDYGHLTPDILLHVSLLSIGYIQWLTRIYSEALWTGGSPASSEFRQDRLVPLAIPFIAGPSAIATVLLLMAKETSRWLEWVTSLVCAWFLSGIILLFSNHISKIVGNRVLTAIERLMGMLLTTVAVEMFIKGARQLLFLH